MALGLTDLVGIYATELRRAFDGLWSEFSRSIQPIDYLVVTNLVVKFVDALDQAMTLARRAPVTALARVLTAYATPETSSRVVTLKQAQAFAMDSLVVALNELMGIKGGNAPLNVAARATKIQGFQAALRESFVRRELTGRNLLVRRVMGLIKIPVRMIALIVRIFYDVFLICAGMGVILGLYTLMTADWNEVALPQTNPIVRDRKLGYRRIRRK